MKANYSIRLAGLLFFILGCVLFCQTPDGKAFAASFTSSTGGGGGAYTTVARFPRCHSTPPISSGTWVNTYNGCSQTALVCVSSVTCTGYGIWFSSGIGSVIQPCHC